MNKIEISEVDEIPRKVGQNEDRVHLVDGISEQNQPAP